MQESTDELIRIASETLNPHYSGTRLFGNVAAAVVSESGKIFTGVCIDTGSGTGCCAEHSAISAMVTSGEYKIETVVAVWRDELSRLYVRPPCGRCREFIRQVDEGNIDTKVILGRTESACLRDLIPYHEWPSPLTES